MAAVRGMVSSRMVRLLNNVKILLWLVHVLACCSIRCVQRVMVLVKQDGFTAFVVALVIRWLVDGQFRNGKFPRYLRMR